MSDVMLINPSSKEILDNAGDRPPLGLLTIAEVLRDEGHDVRVRDMDHVAETDFAKEIKDSPPEYAGVSVYTSPIYNKAVQLAQFLKGKTKTIAGGYHATAMPETLTQYFDTVVVGEGEIALPGIVKEDLTGLVVGPNMEIEDIPHPARDLIDMNDYDFKQDGRKATTMMSSRGCPFSCVFCGNMNRKVRYHTDEHVVDEIQALKQMGFNDLYFYDDEFLINNKRATRLLEKIGSEDVHYRVTARAQSIDKDITKLLKDTGCSWVSLGIESGSNERLRDIHKHMTTEDNAKAIKLLTKYGIKSKGFFMFGVPNETPEDAQKTIDFALYLKQHGLTSADFYIMTPFPGTPIWNHPSDYGITITDKNYTKYLEAGKNPAKAFHKTKYMSEKEIEQWRDKAEISWKVSK